MTENEKLAMEMIKTAKELLAGDERGRTASNKKKLRKIIDEINSDRNNQAYGDALKGLAKLKKEATGNKKLLSFINIAEKNLKKINDIHLKAFQAQKKLHWLSDEGETIRSKAKYQINKMSDGLLNVFATIYEMED